jgi:hypothetical protein
MNREMSQTQEKPFKTAFCSRHEELLVDSKNALEAWTKRRDAVEDLRRKGKGVGDELIRLQATFAKAYEQLQRHTKECVLCAFVENCVAERAVPAGDEPIHDADCKLRESASWPRKKRWKSR